MIFNIKEYEKHLTAELKKRENETLNIYRKLRAFEGQNDKNSLLSLNNTIGSHNSDFAKCKHLSFVNPEEYLAEWYKELNEVYGNRIDTGPNGQYRYIIFEMLRFDICIEYIELFLERTFYREIEKMRRHKPDENLWDVWFGSRNLYWEILLCPLKRSGIWTNDVSKIRATKYQYWTIGHVLATGIVDPENDTIYKFSDVYELCRFYLEVIKRCSNSEYEKSIIDLYIDYIKSESNYNEIPLLIPEMWFGKKIEKA